MLSLKLYLIPGFLTDKTIYLDFLEDERFDCEVLEFIAPQSFEETIESYAIRLAQSIDDSNPFGLLGTSFGGMLASEISKIKKPQCVVFISSVKNREEMNPLMKWDKSTLLLNYVPDIVVKKTIEAGYTVGKKIVPNLKNIDSQEISKMVHAIDGKLEKWIIKTINNWQGENTITNFLHLHGDKDHVFPLKHIKDFELIKGGNHNMILTKSKLIRDKVADFLE